MLSDHLHSITTYLTRRAWFDTPGVLPRGSIAVVSQLLLLALVVDYGRMLWLRFKMVRTPL